MALGLWDKLSHIIGWEVMEESMDPLTFVRKSKHGTAIDFRIAYTFHPLVVRLFCS